MHSVSEPDFTFTHCKKTIIKHDYFGISGYVKDFFEKYIWVENKKFNSGVVGIVSKYGSGKTFFAQTLYCYIKKEIKKTKEICPIYIDISKFEQNQEQLLILINLEINKNIKKLKTTSFFNLAKTLLPIAAKITTNMFLKRFNNIEELIVSETGRIGEKIAEYFIDTINQDEIYIENLKKLTEKISLVIIIDNLDRCRPEFVLYFFSLIKQLFNVDNVVFVLFYDKQQIINLLEVLYGEKVDISSYLYKYIGSEFYLPQYTNMEKFTKEYCHNKLNGSYLNDINKEIIEIKKSETIALKIWIEVYKNTKMSLRQFQHGINIIVFIYRSNKKKEYLDNRDLVKIIINILIIFIKIGYPYLYQSLYYYYLWYNKEDNNINREKEINSIVTRVTQNKVEYQKDIKETIRVLSDFIKKIGSEDTDFEDKNFCEILSAEKIEEMQEIFKNLEIG